MSKEKREERREVRWGDGARMGELGVGVANI